MRRGEYRDLISIQRGTTTDDGLAVIAGALAPAVRRWAKRTDVSDGEKIRAGAQGLELTSRFLVRPDSYTRLLTEGDVIVDGDERHEVTGIKTLPGRDGDIEITTAARPYPKDAPQ